MLFIIFYNILNVEICFLYNIKYVIIITILVWIALVL